MRPLSKLVPALAWICLAAATPAVAQTQAEEQRFQQAQQRFNGELNAFRAEFDRYQQARARGYRDPRGGSYDDSRYTDPRYDDRDEAGYDASRYYRNDPRYQERVLSSNDRVYRGSDEQYYCRRNDGTTGLIVGAVGGGLLGNVIDGGHSRGVGTILGALAGGLVGRSVERENAQVRCR
ncbi:glycine zipper 2TM domain-containing protein [Sphingomonas sp.]|uniref:glycine zipper 2TM domain-containing protein n=1 Tax=Sphingomonas sp. TaxID=28214 RepID=UPI00333F8B9A